MGDAHPDVAAIWELSGSLDGAWRRHFKLPSNDPRYLDATPDLMARDMLEVVYAEVRADHAARPASAVADDPEQVEQMNRLAEELAESKDFAAMVRKVSTHARKTRGSEPVKLPMKLVLAGTIQSDAEDR